MTSKPLETWAGALLRMQYAATHETATELAQIAVNRGLPREKADAALAEWARANHIQPTGEPA
jgi:hypothetical protein